MSNGTSTAVGAAFVKRRMQAELHLGAAVQTGAGASDALAKRALPRET